MATVRKKRKAANPADATASRSPLVRVKTLFVSRLRVVIALLVVGLMGWGMTKVWQQVAPSIIHRPPYLLSAERITATPPPEWIAADVCSEVVHNTGLNGRLSTLDDSFMSVVEDAFVLHPWIASVVKIRKLYPDGVHVEVTYRKPVAVVEMSSPQGMLLVPVDQQAVHLPSKDVPELYKRYLPRIQNVVERPPVGQRWDDLRVTGAADLAMRLSDVWEQLSLVDILPSTRPEILDEHRYYVYDLMTRGGTRVVWGAAPAQAPPGEDDFTAKLERLRSCVADIGPLDSVHSPEVVDVRNQLSVTPRTVRKEVEPRTVKKESPATEETPVVK
ncbi:cell division protein FtsQ/DivIB [Bythopirellula goksoeyrii]|uniref:Cell division protein FtsQ n=1 Tax=Bythopirellula goksoeyrii TaxID=1400387 RepID=A0A5B9QCM2_9BACT|nr:hypothetical protein [Bythopirellula goksoeyrii]QEG35355.1 Cell division protein FtsQ [Bythopirellula goksoeyrii]